jgi:hypothetical protein
MVIVNKGPQWILSCYIFLCEIFTLTCRMMSSERAEASSILVKVQLNFKQTCVVDRISAVYLIINITGWRRRKPGSSF